MVPTIKRCSVAGCDRPVVAKGICELHRTRLRRHGNLDVNLRPADWGDRRKHPLYKYWTQIRRNGTEVIEAWHSDFWDFVAAVGDRPSSAHTLYRMDKSAPMGPHNCAWAESKAGPARDGKHTATRAGKTAYMQEYNRQRRGADPLLQMRINLLRTHGLTLDDYEHMMDAQDGVCAICGRPEHRISTNAGRAMRLAVDHDHATAKIRGLLCSMCNHAIGYFEDSPALLQRAMDYLRSPPADVLGIAHNGKHKVRRVERQPSPYAGDSA